ncbi:MAG: hypothetical protein ACI3YO_06880, partial [Prevotella sp.]
RISLCRTTQRNPNDRFGLNKTLIHRELSHAKYLKSAINQQSISNQMIFLRIAVRLLTIAVHNEMILESHLFLIQQQLSAINQQSISN